MKDESISCAEVYGVARHKGDLVGAVLSRWCTAIRCRPDPITVTNSWLYVWTQSRGLK